MSKIRRDISQRTLVNTLPVKQILIKSCCFTGSHTVSFCEQRPPCNEKKKEGSMNHGIYPFKLSFKNIFSNCTVYELNDYKFVLEHLFPVSYGQGQHCPGLAIESSHSRDKRVAKFNLFMSK